MMNYYAEDNMILYSYSEVGRHHIIERKENQDSVYAGKVDEDTFCIAVADGVSSCMYAKQGSLAAVDTVRNLVMEINSGAIDCEDVDNIRRYVVRDWKKHFQDNWNDYGTTLSFVIIHKSRLVIGQIGDGLLLLKNGPDRINLTDMDEFYSAETYALSEVVLKSSFTVMSTEKKGNLAIVAMTDGIGKELDLDTIEGFKDSIVKMVKDDKEKLEFEIKDWISHLNEKNDDDKTIGILILEE